MTAVWTDHIKSAPRDRGKFKPIRDKLAFVATVRGELSLSFLAWKELGEPMRVKFRTDTNGRGAFMKCEPDDPNGYKVQDLKNPNARRVSMKSVATKYGLYDKQSDRLYDLKKENDMLIFHLGQGYSRL